LDTLDFWAYERAAWADGMVCVVGLDEAGRGPLAGPVVASAVVLPKKFKTDGIGDSKSLTPAARDRAYDRIMKRAVSVGVGVVDVDEIDRVNILQATYIAMRAALANVSAAFDFILVDGLPVPDLPARSKAIVKGDMKSVSIGAASIIAKVTRDRIMLEIDVHYPEYGFSNHKGYGTPEHLAAIAKHGPCPCHRRSFAPIAERLANCRLPGLE
jgi:ribonuclease HII